MTTEPQRDRGRLLDSLRRERDETAARLGEMRGLMPLLMKRRNGACWSKEERTQLIRQLRALAHVSPYLVILVLPGSFLVLPVYAWWLDRRRAARARVAQPSDIS